MTLAKWYGKESLESKVYPLLCGECAQKTGDETLVEIDDVDGAMWVCACCNLTYNELNTFPTIGDKQNKTK